MQNQPIAIAAVTDSYPAFAARLNAVLNPVGILEKLFGDEITRLSWRMEQPDTTEEFRAGATVSIRRDLAELRRLQTDRHLKAELNLDWPGLVSVKEVLRVRKLHHDMSLKLNESQKLQNEANLPPVTTVENSLDSRFLDEQKELLRKFTERTQFQQENRASEPYRPSPAALAGRNEPCPCGSGQKYKRCCGHWSQKQAA